MFHKVQANLGIRSARTRNISKHVVLSIFYKGGTVIANFMLVPLTIDYLDNENYGIWLTLSSFVAWFSFFDLGLGHGLRNKLAEAKALGKYQEAQSYVSTAYFTIGIISLLLICIFLVLNQFIDWTAVFNTSNELRGQLALLLPVIIAFFGIQLVAKLISTIFQAYQYHSIQNKIQFYTQILSLLIIWLLTKSSNGSLLLFGSIFASLPVIILIGLNFFAFKTYFRNLRPVWKQWKIKYLKDITGLGLNFFVIQIAALVLFSTDNFIITKLFSPKDVVPYNVAFKYFSIVTFAYTILITPFWSSFTEAYSQGDIEWIKRSIRNVQKIWFIVPVGLIVMVLCADWFYTFWIGTRVQVPINLTLAMAFFVALTTFEMIYVHFINGVGIIKLQLLTSIISIIINIPLSIFFVRSLGFGTEGVILATCVSLLYTAILRPLQYYKIITNSARGIWIR